MAPVDSDISGSQSDAIGDIGLQIQTDRCTTTLFASPNPPGSPMDELTSAATKPLLGAFHLLLLMGVVYVVVTLVSRHFLTDLRRRSQKSVRSTSNALGYAAMAFVAVLYFFSKSSIWGATSTLPEGKRQNALSSRPSVYREVDSRGDSLMALVKSEYARVYSQEGTTCRAIYNRQGNEWVPLEIDQCQINLATSSSISHADSLNGIDLQGAGTIGGKAFRLNINGTWTEWSSLPSMMTFTPPIHFSRKFGRFELTPDNNFKTLRPLP
jgi:hypothetical protein